MHPRTRLFTALIALILGIGAGLLFYLYTPQPTQTKAPIAAPKPADPLTQVLNTPILDRQGHKTTLQAWKQKILVINFWATWCGPCQKEIPELSALRYTWASPNIEFIGIAIDFPMDVDRFMTANPNAFPKPPIINYPVLLAPDEGTDIMRQLGNMQGVLPFTIIIDRTGTTPRFESITGVIQKEDLAARLAKLSKQLPK